MVEQATIKAHCPRCGVEIEVPVQVAKIERETSMTTGSPILEVSFDTINVPHRCDLVTV